LKKPTLLKVKGVLQIQDTIPEVLNNKKQIVGPMSNPRRSICLGSGKGLRQYNSYRSGSTEYGDSTTKDEANRPSEPGVYANLPNLIK